MRPLAILAAALLMSACAERADLMPNVRFVDKADMPALRCPAGRAEDCANTQALYNPLTRTIYLRRGFDPSDLYDASTLVHEFIHHVQRLSRRQYPCPQAREKEAYAAQLAYLDAAGVDDPVGFIRQDGLNLLMITNCQMWP